MSRYSVGAKVLALMQQNGRSQINKLAEHNFLSAATALFCNEIHYLITRGKGKRKSVAVFQSHRPCKQQLNHFL